MCGNVQEPDISDAATINNYLSTYYYKEDNLLEKLFYTNIALTKLWPFLTYIDGLCVEFYSKPINSLHLGECKKIKSFQLKNNIIREVPKYITSFNCIYDLNFYKNKLSSSCFDTISELSTLRSLNLGNNLIEKISKSILKLINLTKLSLFGCTLTYVPKFISNLKLKELDLGGLKPSICDFETNYNKEYIVMKIINEFTKITSPEYLKLCYNKITNLNFYHKNYFIKTLNLSHNNLTTLPNSILGFENLEYLDLTLNKFTKIPSIIVKLEKLKKLVIVGNKIAFYNDVVFHSLETLHISFDIEYNRGNISIKNNISPLKELCIYTRPYSYNICSDIYNMISLKSLRIYGPILITKDDKIDRLENLELLCIDSIIIDEYMDSIFNLKNLKIFHLNLRFTKTKGFPSKLFSDLTKFKKLEILYLNDFNNESRLDNKLFDLETLKELKLSGFFIKNVDGFYKLRNLKCISIKNIKFKESKEKVKLCLFRSIKKVKYKSCTYNEKEEDILNVV